MLVARLRRLLLCRQDLKQMSFTIISICHTWHYMDLRYPWLHPLGCSIFQYCNQMFAFLQFVAIFSNTATNFQNISNFGCSIGKYSNKKLQKGEHLVAILKILQPRGATKGLGRPYNDDYYHKIRCCMMLTHHTTPNFVVIVRQYRNPRDPNVVG